MSGGFPQGLDLCNANDIGVSTSTSNGTSVLTGAANTLGSWVQLSASTPCDCSWLEVAVSDNLSSGSNNLAVDIGVGGAGSEVVIANGLIAMGSGLQGQVTHFAFPCSIPAGTRLAARAQGATATDHVAVSAKIFDSAYTQMEGCAGVDAIGFVSASTQGTTITASGSTNTKGSYAQLIASTARDYIGYFLAFDGMNTTYAANGRFLVDIAIGGAGSEVVIDGNITVLTAKASAGDLLPTSRAIKAIAIPAGTRIAARCQSSTASQALGLTLYGVYQ